MSRTKIVATIGPCSNRADVVQALVAAGMSVARLNGAHGDLQWHAVIDDEAPKTEAGPA